MPQIFIRHSVVVGHFRYGSIVSTLADFKVGDVLEVIQFEGESQYEFKFISLGILPGDKLEIQSKSVLGGPISVKHEGAIFFALRLDYAKKIIVKNLGKNS